ncbi:MAG: hypothetical protein EOS23_02935 [Mesorhizobium sp.]|nr:MAG: hypothetical protein EOS23_02935 [Mesorhizobium sp.]
MIVHDALPAWFTATTLGPDFIEGAAYLPGTVWGAAGLTLRITFGRHPGVSEAVPGTCLPRQCPERHIFPDSRFCMSLDPAAVTSRAAADRWWEDLAQYIMCQSVAETTGLWPLHNGLDHGKAGYFHALALDLAERLGIAEEYFAVHDKQLPEFSTSTRERFRHSALFRRFLAHERARRAALDKYEFEAGMSGVACCGAMRNCPYLRSVERCDVLIFAGLQQRLLTTTALNLLLQH